MTFSSEEGRPPIPADIRRRVFVEAGHRCAIPTCRYIEVDIHHTIPWAQCKTHDYENLSAICPNCHRRADGGDIDRRSLRLYKLNLRFIHDKYSQLEMDTLFELALLPDGYGMPWLGFMLILLKRLLDSQFISYYESADGMFMGALKTSPDTIYITPKGRHFIAELGISEL